VLAKDCSREQPRFVVLMKKSEQQKKVKIMTQQGIIELSSKSSNSDTPTVKINGKQVQQQEELADEGVETSYGKVYVSKGGVRVEFDGEEAKVKVGGMYKNIQCGLCGHYNDEEDDTFHGANGKKSNSVKDFHRSYTLKNEECDESRVNKFYEGQDSSEFSIRPNKNQRGMQWSSNNEQDEQQDENSSDSFEQEGWTNSNEKSNQRNPKPVDRTEVIEYSHKLCFSIKPVKRCPRGSRAEESETKEKVPFVCYDRNNSQARQLQRQVRQGQVADVEDKAPAFVETVQQPTKCVSAY